MAEPVFFHRTGALPGESGTEVFPAAGSEYDWFYISPYNCGHVFTPSGQAYPTDSLIRFAPYTLFGDHDWISGFRPASFACHVYFDSSGYEGDVTVEVVDTGNNVIGSASFPISAYFDTNINLSLPLTFGANDLLGYRIVLDGPTTQATARISYCAFNADFDFPLVNHGPEFWTSDPYAYGLVDVPYENGAVYFFYSTSNPHDGYIEFDDLYDQITPIPQYVVTHWTLANPANWESALAAVAAAGGTYAWKVDVVDGTGAVIGTGTYELDPAANYVANPHFRIDIELDTAGTVDKLDAMGAITGGVDIAGEYVTLSYLRFADSIEAPVEDMPTCRTKPTRIEITQAGSPGTPGWPGQPYQPGFWYTPPCRTYTVDRFIGATGVGYERTEYDAYPGWSYSSEGSLVEGYGATTISSPINVSGDGSAGGSAGSVVGGFVNDTWTRGENLYASITETECYPPIWIPPVPYIAPIPASEPTETEYRVLYDLGWNYDVQLGAGQDIAVDISTAEVSRTTAGVLVGITEDWRATLAGAGKYHLAIEFSADDVSVLRGGDRVWGATIRAADDVFAIERVGAQVQVLRNGVVVYTDDTFWTGGAAFVATIWKGGDRICLPDIRASVAPGEVVNPGGGDALLPALEAIGHEGAYADGRGILPALEGDGFSIEARLHWKGLGAATLPAFEAHGFQGDGYAFADALLPAFEGWGDAGFSIPVAQGGDGILPSLQGAAHGVGGDVLTGDVELPAFDAIGSEGTYGIGSGALPAIGGSGVVMPTYDGILSGVLPAVVSDTGWYVTVYPPNTLAGVIGPVSGSLSGGGLIEGTLTLTGSFTVDAAVMVSFDGVLRVEGALSVLAGGVAQIDGTLGPVTGSLAGGGILSGRLPAVTGSLSGAAGLVATITGEIGPMQMTAFVTAGEVINLSGVLPELAPVWGSLSGALPALSGRLLEAGVAVDRDVAWAMNLSHLAITRYPDFQFDHLLRFRGNTYLVRADGIYLVGGDSDAGAYIHARFALPDGTFGDIAEKVCPRAYLQGRSVGGMSVTPVVDGEAFEAQVTSESRGDLDYVRAKFGRGLRGHHWAFEVANADGKDFEVDSFDMLIKSTGRRY